MAAKNRWLFTKEQLENSPSRRCGYDAAKELSCRQQAANLIQNMGKRLRVNQLCINTAIVYMHRFFVFHSFTHFHRNSIAAASLFLAAKVEEQWRRIEHVINVFQFCSTKNHTLTDVHSEEYLSQAADLVMNESILLMTLGFDSIIDHPHMHIVQCCHFVRVSKDVAQTSYFMATDSLHLTTMCLQFKPTVVACFCIHLACKRSNWEIPQSNEGKPWFWYVDKTVTLQLLEKMTKEFSSILKRCPPRLKKRIYQQNSQNSLSSQNFSLELDASRKDLSHRNPGVCFQLPISTMDPQQSGSDNTDKRREQVNTSNLRQSCGQPTPPTNLHRKTSQSLHKDSTASPDQQLLQLQGQQNLPPNRVNSIQSVKMKQDSGLTKESSVPFQEIDQYGAAKQMKQAHVSSAVSGFPQNGTTLPVNHDTRTELIKKQPAISNSHPNNNKKPHSSTHYPNNGLNTSSAQQSDTNSSVLKDVASTAASRPSLCMNSFQGKQKSMMKQDSLSPVPPAPETRSIFSPELTYSTPQYESQLPYVEIKTEQKLFCESQEHLKKQQFLQLQGQQNLPPNRVNSIQSVKMKQDSGLTNESSMPFQEIDQYGAAKQMKQAHVSSAVSGFPQNGTTLPVNHDTRTELIKKQPAISNSHPNNNKKPHSSTHYPDNGLNTSSAQQSDTNSFVLKDVASTAASRPSLCMNSFQGKQKSMMKQDSLSPVPPAPETRSIFSPEFTSSTPKYKSQPPYVEIKTEQKLFCNDFSTKPSPINSQKKTQAPSTPELVPVAPGLEIVTGFKNIVGKSKISVTLSSNNNDVVQSTTYVSTKKSAAVNSSEDKSPSSASTVQNQHSAKAEFSSINLPVLSVSRQYKKKKKNKDKDKSKNREHMSKHTKHHKKHKNQDKRRDKEMDGSGSVPKIRIITDSAPFNITIPKEKFKVIPSNGTLKLKISTASHPTDKDEVNHDPRSLKIKISEENFHHKVHIKQFK